ncbi:hypothetical protein ACFLVZ_01140 [Chloroflexota bacterium]
MLLASQIILIIAGLLLIGDTLFIITHRSNPINKDWPLPCPVTLILLGLGIILLAIALF